MLKPCAQTIFLCLQIILSDYCGHFEVCIVAIAQHESYISYTIKMTKIRVPSKIHSEKNPKKKMLTPIHTQTLNFD